MRISEALQLKASDVRRVDGTAKSVCVIGQGDQERRAPLPEAFGQGFGFWLKDQPRGEFAFARAAGQQPVSAQAACAYRRGMLEMRTATLKPVCVTSSAKPRRISAPMRVAIVRTMARPRPEPNCSLPSGR